MLIRKIPNKPLIGQHIHYTIFGFVFLCVLYETKCYFYNFNTLKFNIEIFDVLTPYADFYELLKVLYQPPEMNVSSCESL